MEIENGNGERKTKYRVQKDYLEHNGLIMVLMKRTTNNLAKELTRVLRILEKNNKLSKIDICTMAIDLLKNDVLRRMEKRKNESSSD